MLAGYHAEITNEVNSIEFLHIKMDDPKYFTKPWSEEFHMIFHPTWNLLEFVCNENDRCSGGHCVESDAQKP